MPPTKGPHLTIVKSKLLIVEGPSDKMFFDKLLSRTDIAEVQVEHYGGTAQLGSFLRALTATPGFRQVTSLGLVRDADDNPQGAFDSLRNSLESAKLPIPSQPMTIQLGTPQVAALILPDHTRPGMLETLCIEAVANDPAASCVEAYLDCIVRSGITINNRPKAFIQAFLASRPEAGLLLGQAAQRNYFPWESSAFDHIREFLQQL